MAEWLRRWTRNPMGYSRAGSNPVHSDVWLEFGKIKYKSTCCVLFLINEIFAILRDRNFIVYLVKFGFEKSLRLKLLPEVGFEPTRTYVHWILSPTP